MRPAGSLPGIAAVIAALLAGACLPAPARASESVALQTSFAPDRLGASTTIGFAFQIANTDGGVPSPLTSVALHLPKDINYLSSTLGLAICQPAALLAGGAAACPPNSRLGTGSAFVEVPFGTSAGYEIPDIQALMGPPRNGNIVVLFYADGREPVSAQVIFQGELIAGTATLGGSLSAAVPLIPSVNGGPPVSILSVHTMIGPEHLTYYEHVHGRTVSFHPHGVDVPLSCPRGGFRFSADFSFTDTTNVTATSTVPCPQRT
jgi:hypothetical protein